jgi:myo-inositol-1-phosphate synthase
MGPILDGIAEHMQDAPAERAFRPAAADPVDVARVLRDVRADVLVCYLPVGSEDAVRAYAQAALDAGVAFVNCVPVFIASDPEWAARFTAKRLPVVGDDIKSQLGATITHRMLTDLFHKRGVKLERTYQLNTGGNTDFLNMLNQSRLASKKESKTEAVQSVAGERIPDENIHVGPSDYVAWQNDNKVCFLRMEGRLFGDVPMNLELRLSVEDSPNSAGIVIDVIRSVKLARERGLAGPLLAVSAFSMKHPPVQMRDALAARRVEEFVAGHGDA